jgi:hypothetical protein
MNLTGSRSHLSSKSSNLSIATSGSSDKASFSEETKEKKKKKGFKRLFG